MHTSVAAKIGLTPYKIKGIRIKNIIAAVAIIEMKLKSPFNLPSIINPTKNNPPNQYKVVSLLKSAIKKSTSSSLPTTSSFASRWRITLSPLESIISYAGLLVRTFSISCSLPLKSPVRTLTFASCFVIDCPLLSPSISM